MQWRVALTRGYAHDPNSFCVVYGGRVDGLAELIKSYDPKYRFERLPGTSVRRDAGGDLDANMLHEQIEAWKANHPYERKKGWRRLMQVMFEPPEEKFDMSYVEVPFCNLNRSVGTYRAFETTRGEINDIAETLGRAWVRLCLPRIEARLNYPDLYADYWGPSSSNINRHTNYDPEFYAAAKIAADQGWIDIMAEQVFSHTRRSYEEVWQACKSNGEFVKQGRKVSESEEIEITRLDHQYALMRAKTVICIAEAMDIKLPEHGVDFESFGMPIVPFRRR